MKIVFVDDNQNIKEHETLSQDIKRIFQIADKLSDTELEKLETIINKLPKITDNKNYD